MYNSGGYINLENYNISGTKFFIYFTNICRKFLVEREYFIHCYIFRPEIVKILMTDRRHKDFGT